MKSEEATFAMATARPAAVACPRGLIHLFRSRPAPTHDATDGFLLACSWSPLPTFPNHEVLQLMAGNCQKLPHINSRAGSPPS